MKFKLHMSPNSVASISLIVLLAACSHKVDPVANTDPSVIGNRIVFPSNAPELQRLITGSLIDAHENTLSLPAHLVWDEDHTSRSMPPVSGHLDEISVQLGSLVKEKQVLGFLRSPDLGSAQADATRAQADLTQAEHNLARIKSLIEVNGAAGKELELAEADLTRAQAEASRTRLKLESLGAHGNVVDQRYVIRSSIPGVVIERNTNPGLEWHPDQPSAPLFVVSDPTYLWCWIDAPESALNMLHAGMKVIVKSSAWPQEKYEARVDYVADGLDPMTRTIKVRAHLRNLQRHLKGEMYVTAVLSSQTQGVIDVPAKAVFLFQGEQYVFVKTNTGEFSRQHIVPVASNESWVSVAQGLNKQDQVVVDGALFLQKILDDAGSAAAQAGTAQTPVVGQQSVK